MTRLETETIDKLFLELSQVSQAKTARELALEETVRQLLIDIDSFDKGGTLNKLRSVGNARAILQ